MSANTALPSWIETGLLAAVSEIQRRNRERGYFSTDEIQRRNRERGYFSTDSVGHTCPAITAEEMLKVLRKFLKSSQEGLG